MIDVSWQLRYVGRNDQIGSLWVSSEAQGIARGKLLLRRGIAKEAWVSYGVWKYKNTTWEEKAMKKDPMEVANARVQREYEGNDEMTFTQFVTSLWNRPEEMRAGQYAFNQLAQVKPAIAMKVRGSILLDPFFNDDKIMAFLNYVEGEWDR